MSSVHRCDRHQRRLVIDQAWVFRLLLTVHPPFLIIVGITMYTSLKRSASVDTFAFLNNNEEVTLALLTISPAMCPISPLYAVEQRSRIIFHVINDRGNCQASVICIRPKYQLIPSRHLRLNGVFREDTQDRQIPSRGRGRHFRALQPLGATARLLQIQLPMAQGSGTSYQQSTKVI